MATSQAATRGLSQSMRLVIFTIRKRFPSVSHVNCSQVAELAKSQDVVYLVRKKVNECMVLHLRVTS